MELLIWLVVITLLLVAGFFWLQSVRKRNMEQISQAVSRQAAQAAAAKLDEESRKDIYRHLAKGDTMGAVQRYRALTGASVKECVIAVRSMEAYPQTGTPAEPQVPDLQEPDGQEETRDPVPQDQDQVTGTSAADALAQREPEGGQPAEEPGAGNGEPAAAGQEPGDDCVDTGQLQSLLPSEDFWVVPAEWNEKFGSDKQPGATHFKLAYEIDGGQQEFSSEKLPPNEYDQLFSMLRDGDTAGAAKVLHEHTQLPIEDLERMIATSPMAGGQGAGNVADFRFEGQGPDGPVHFDAADLPEDEREELFAAIARTDLEAMSAIIVKHTSLPEDIVQNMLRSFVQREE